MSILLKVFLIISVFLFPFGKDLKKPKSNSSSLGLEYIVFGLFCGECKQHCAIMYRLNLNENSKKLFIDSTDSFFLNKGKILFNKKYSNEAKINLAKSIIATIPSYFFEVKSENTFGCPDCSDGCGVYFEFKRGGKIKKFYIDTDTTKLVEPAKSFEINARKIITQINNVIN